MIDTNILLDWLLDRNEHRTKLIVELFAGVEELHIPDVVIVELVFALEKFYNLPRHIVSDNLNKVIDEPGLICTRLIFQRALVEYLQHSTWPFLDCCLLDYAESQNKLPVWTFDKKLVGQSSGKVKSPS